MLEILDLLLSSRANIRLAAVRASGHFSLTLESEMTVGAVIYRHNGCLLSDLSSEIFEEVAPGLHRKVQVVTKSAHFLELDEHEIYF